MAIRFQLALLAVKSVERSKRFYEELFDQTVTLDLGKNVTFSGGFAIQEDFPWLVGLPSESVAKRPHNMELYFETEDFDAFLEKLAAHPDVEHVHPPKKYDWQQRVVRIYDPDRHIIEIGESMAVIARRYLSQGCSVEETAAIIQHPVAFVEEARSGVYNDTSTAAGQTPCSTSCEENGLNIRLKEMTADDLAIFKRWLSRPHVAKWYHDPSAWIEEIEKQEDEFRWLHHFVVEHGGSPIGFCQYYACADSEELWEGYTAMGGSYSIDYLIGDPDWLRKGIGRQIVAALTERITRHPDAQRIVVQPEEENKASCGLLLSCGFVFDTQTGIYVKAI